MKQLRKLAVVTAAVAALFACSGIASAQAESVSLCKANEATCSAANQYISGTVFEFGNPTLVKFNVPGIGEVTCDSQIVGDSTAATAEPTLPGEISATKWSSCAIEKTTCTVTTVNSPYRLSIEKGAVKGNGTFNITPRTGAGNPGMTIVCGTKVNCTYTVAKMALPFVGGAVGAANLKANAIVFTGAGKTCGGANPTYTAQWNMETPSTTELFVSS